MKKVKNFFEKIFWLLKKSCKVIYTNRRIIFTPKGFKRYFKSFIRKIKNILKNDIYDLTVATDYNNWLNENRIDDEIGKFSYNPLISIIIPVYNIEKNFLSECLDSILNQTYQNFEVCLSDDCSTKKETVETLKKYEEKDPRIKVFYRKENGHISKCSNSALEIATGEFIALMDDDDILTPNALYEVVKVLNNNQDIDLIYSDEDKMEMDGTLCEPNFKPDYSPDTILGGNYICHFSVYRKKIIDKLGGFRSEYDGAQDFDLVLRFVECTNKIFHISKVLYHWRKVPGSTAVTVENKEYAILNGKKCVEDALKRRHVKAEVIVPIKSTNYIVNYLINKEPKITIVIDYNAQKNYNTLNSICKKTNYKNFDIVINNKTNKNVEIEIDSLIKKYNVNISIKEDSSRLECDYLLFLDGNMKIVNSDWLKIMVGYASQEHIGAVGAKIISSNNLVLSGGLVLGVSGIAEHTHQFVDRDSLGFYGRLVIPFNYSAVSRKCLMISKNKYNEVGGFDCETFQYDDIDLCLKLLEKGYYNVFLPQVEVCYTGKFDKFSNSVIENKKNIHYMYEKWSNIIQNDPFYNINFSKKSSFMLDKKKIK